MDSDFPRGHRSTSLTTLIDVVTPPPVGDPRLIGRRLEGRYEILRALDRGGMATVYVALDHRLDREVAVKVMHPALAHDPAFVGRFAREAKAAASIRHRNVVAVTDTGEDGGEVFLVMDLVRGRTLRALLTERTRLDPARALEVAEPVLAALDAAHRAGLVHRDVKPENVLLGDDGTIAVADFGLARAIEASSLTTHAGLLLGTVAYVAPEQVEHGRADARSDVYAAGVMLFEMLTGRVPYDADTPVAVAFRHVHEHVPPPSTLAPGIPSEVDDLVLAATARDPDERYADAGSFLAALRRVRRQLPQARRGDTAVLGTTVLGATVLNTAVVDTAVEDPRAADGVTLPPRGGTTAAPRVVVPPPPERARTDDPPRPRRRWPWVLAVLVLLSVGAGAGGWWLARDAKTHVPALTDRSLAAVQASLTSHHLAWRVGRQRALRHRPGRRGGHDGAGARQRRRQAQRRDHRALVRGADGRGPDREGQHAGRRDRGAGWRAVRLAAGHRRLQRHGPERTGHQLDPGRRADRQPSHDGRAGRERRPTAGVHPR